MPIETPLHAVHEKAGAAFAEYFRCVMPERFSATSEEYRFAQDSAALIDTNYRAFFYLSGPDRARYLNAVLTNDILHLGIGEGNVSLLLNPQGHILAEIEVYGLPDRFLASSHALVGERTATTLEKYIIMDDVTFADATGLMGSIALQGPKSLALVRDSCALDPTTMPEYGHAEADLYGVACRIVRKALYGQPGVEIFVAREQLAALWSALLGAVRARGGGPVGYAAFNALRLEAGIPWFGADFDDTVIPHEAGLEVSHINYSKGCYTGQEIVERVRSRGHVNRRQVGLRFPGTALPPPGAPLMTGGSEVGRVTSATHSPVLGAGIGMGYVRREFAAAGTPLEWSGGTADVISLPLAPRKGATAHSA